MNNFESHRDALLWSVQLSVRYHNHRRGFYDFVYNSGSFITVFFSSATIYFVLNSLPSFIIVITSSVVSFFSAVSLVLTITKKARDHFDFARQFITLERKIIKLENDDEGLKECRDMRLAIETDEPPVLRVLWLYCYNEMMILRKTEEGNILKFKWFHPFTKHFCDFMHSRIDIDEEYQKLAISRLINARKAVTNEPI